jgi:thiamine-monophosphate kinase
MTDYREPSDPSLHDVGESGVLSSILAALAAHPAASVVLGPGDDSAVFAIDGDAVVSTDAMVEGVDFRLDWSSGFELGWKLAATNLSDIAAMGAVPKALTVTVLAPSDTPVRLLQDVTSGLTEACQVLAPGCAVVGGDLSRSPVLAFSVTAIGETGTTAPVTRGGAKPGDIVAYAGQLGFAGYGLRLLSDQCATVSPASQDSLARLWQEYPDALAAQLAPSPPVALGLGAALAGATAMMDVSDSLSLDAARLGKASDVTLNLAASALQPELDGMTLDDILFGGEDHGLLATFTEPDDLPTGFRQIGTVQRRTEQLLVDGAAIEPRGWDPYRAER